MSHGTGNSLAWSYNIQNDIWNKLQMYELILLDDLTEQEMQRIRHEIFSKYYN